MQQNLLQNQDLCPCPFSFFQFLLLSIARLQTAMKQNQNPRLPSYGLLTFFKSLRRKKKKRKTNTSILLDSCSDVISFQSFLGVSECFVCWSVKLKGGKACANSPPPFIIYLPFYFFKKQKKL